MGNATVTEPAGKVTEAGTSSVVGLLGKTAAIRLPVVLVERVIVQVVRAPTVKAVGVQESDKNVGGRERVRPKVVEEPFRVAVITEVAAMVRVPVVTAKVAEEAPEGTKTEAGTVRAGLLLARVTRAPAAGAG